MDLQHGNGSSKNFNHVEVTNNEVDSRPRIIFPSTFSTENSQGTLAIDTDVLNEIRIAKQDVSVVEGESSAESSHRGSSSFAAHSSETLMMGQPKGYDPNRIPASVFGTKPANCTEWSVASNESLFSLHMGTGSFSREHFLTLYKSGELGKLEVPMKPVKPDESITISKPADEQIHFQPSLPPVTEGEYLDKMSEENLDTPKAAIVETDENQSPPSPAVNAHVACPSQGSVNSTKSFAFRALEDREGYTTKLSKTDSEKNPSRNKHPREEPSREKQPQTPKTTIRATVSSWFSCFPCFSMCQSGRN